jgi:hypothetical protein
MTTENFKTVEPAGLTELKANLREQYGYLLGHAQLREVLGYRTASAFQRASELGRVGLEMFTVPGRRGKFALSADVAEWLWRAKEGARQGKACLMGEQGY